MNPELVFDVQALLGEGPVWDHRTEVLNWVDIELGELHFFSPDSSVDRHLKFSKRLGVAIPCSRPGSYILGLEDGIALYNNENENLRYISRPESHLPNNRFNDGKCDPSGRFWVGSMDMGARAESASLYCLDTGMRTSLKLPRATISNGLAWNSDSSLMYYIDTAFPCVYAFDFQKNTAEISNRRVLINIPEHHGLPDGMCIDEQGKLWIAHWGGFNVSRWDPDTGKLLAQVKLPVPQPTSCTFGGKELDTLFITSARTGLSPEMLKRYPKSGGIFGVKTGVRGMQADFFKLPDHSY
jgi:sugar lactone lactonase YvrE